MEMKLGALRAPSIEQKSDLETDIYKRNVNAQWNIWHMLCCKILVVGVALASKILHLLSPQKEKRFFIS